MKNRPEDFVTDIAQYCASKGGYIHQQKPNQCGLKPVHFEISVEKDRETFNEIYKTLKKSNLGTLVRTKSGGIKLCKENRRGVWDFKAVNVGVVITAILEGYTFCYRIGNEIKSTKDDKSVSGTTAFFKFKTLCLENGIDLEDYAIDNGAEVKDTIPAPKISMKYIMTKDDEGIANCHHIDFHNSYPAGLCNTHPEFRPIVEPLYESRKTNPENKAILNLTIGYMQSKNPSCKARWAHLSKDAIIDNNNRIDALAAKLEASGHDILGYNTDGIWYSGEIYHGEGEGKHLGEWENDHTNCLFRSKSDGAYEFIEDGQYHAVVRGKTNYDFVESREHWQWGDIFRHGLTFIKYRWDKDEGVVPAEVEA